MTKSKARKSYSNWLNRLSDQSLNLGVPTLVLPEDIYTTTSSPFWSETDDTNEFISIESNSTKYPTKIVLDFDLETPWHVLKNQSVPSRTSSPTTTTTGNSMKPQMIHSSVSSNNSAQVEPHPIINLNYNNLNQTAIVSTTSSPAMTTKPQAAKPFISGTNFNLETPWNILKNQSLMAASSLLKNKTNVASTAQTVEVIMWT